MKKRYSWAIIIFLLFILVILGFWGYGKLERWQLEKMCKPLLGEKADVAYREKGSGSDKGGKEELLAFNSDYLAALAERYAGNKDYEIYIGLYDFPK
ncbi:hypothetical protein SAMN02745221_01631 [Thermosyntropha lipolytica DSM 11003]|uniref:Uncharacterized protein n=1 Tax=Thermosyntropha lipolytica DSM 11003 TaxID=1123382 RepID=A0A1M5Q134_9FIRM|nr:hypothetical protein [Thermosyntropha lipolytica]SHH07987.1 hypothetical protein SAMN02745221_01631 [Thermosyntropha lipolytica DSM 11003]